MLRTRRTLGLVARFAAWAAWLATMLFVPGALRYASYLEKLPEGWADPFDLWFFVPWSAAIPLAFVAAALTYSFRERIAGRRSAFVIAAVAALVAYLGLSSAYYRGAFVTEYALRGLLVLLEKVARYTAWGLWGSALVTWVLPAETLAEKVGSPLDGRPGAEALTEREREVAELLVSGSTQAHAAEALGISASSVGTYRARACEKLGVASLDELVPRAYGAASVPSRLDVGAAGSLPLMALALCAGMILHYVTGYSPYLSFASQVDLVAVPVLALTVPWGCLFAYARLRGMRVRHREASGRLVLVLVTLVAFGFSAGGMDPLWVSLPSQGAPQTMVSLSLVALVGYVASLVLFAPHLLWPVVREVTTLDEERCVLYLRGRGAGELQARVLTEIALGRSAPEICEALHVVRGTVNAYRAQGYELLGVHSSKELADLLARDVGRVPSAGKREPSAEDSATSA